MFNIVRHDSDGFTYGFTGIIGVFDDLDKAVESVEDYIKSSIYSWESSSTADFEWESGDGYSSIRIEETKLNEIVY